MLQTKRIMALAATVLLAFSLSFAQESLPSGYKNIKFGMTVDEVKDIVDEAIAKANKKNLKHFFDVLCSNRYDEEDMIILREKDFEA